MGRPKQGCCEAARHDGPPGTHASQAAKALERRGKPFPIPPPHSTYPLAPFPLSTSLSPLLSTHSLKPSRPFPFPCRIAARVDDQAAALFRPPTTASISCIDGPWCCVLCAARPSGTDGARFLEHLRVVDPVPFRSDPRRRSSPAMSQVDPKRGVPICNATALVRHSPYLTTPLNARCSDPPPPGLL